MTLTPELIALGWFDADENFKPKPFALYQAMKIFDDGSYAAPSIAMSWDELITDDMDDGTYFFREVAPVIPAPTPPQIVLSVEDAETVLDAILNSHNLKRSEREEKYGELFNNIKTQLEAMK